MELILSPEQLDSLYRAWRAKGRSPDYQPSKFDNMITYQRQHRDGANRRFEDWLFENGFTVFQKDKKRYLKFSGNDRQLTVFLLKWM